MKRSIYLIWCVVLTAFISIPSLGQQGNVWYFGNHAGLDFNSGSPVTFTTSALATDEGCAAVCDASGNPLFYTDGTTIWDATNAVVTTALNGHSSSTQSAVIVPRPGSSTNYFIFTMDRQHISTANNGMNYTEVQVIGSTVSVVTLNTPLLSYTNCTEKIAASCHANGTDYWVTTLQRDGQFRTWPVTSAGVGASFLSAVTAVPNPSGNGDDRVGYMKVSSQGNRLVVGRRASNSQSELFDFDNSTGQVTFNHGVYNTGTVYGVEFSANGNYFYVSRNFNRVYMYDVSSLTPTLLHTSNGTDGDRVGALQMGPDGEIYVANGYEYKNGPFLDKISNVETGTPTYHDNFIALPGGTFSRLGLPDIVGCFVPTVGCNVAAGFNIDLGQTECEYHFTDVSTAGGASPIVSWEWTFGDGYSSTEQNPSHFYSTPGTYTVCLTVTALNGDECCTSTICQDVTVRAECNEDCFFDHYFDWSIFYDCDTCVVQFNGQVGYGNRPVLAWIWDFGDGTTGSGQNPTHTYTTNGTYTVCVTVIGRTLNADGTQGCCVFKYCMDITIDCAKDNPDDPTTGKPGKSGGATSGGTDESFKVYPNPTTGTINMEMEVERSQAVQITLMDYTGTVYWSASDVEANEGDWSHSFKVDLPSGIYLLMVEGRDFVNVRKIVVEK